MLEENSAATTDTPTREIVTTRVFDAPPDRVFEAWSRSEHLEQWWGPRGFTTTTQAFDFRTGGGWKHTMHGPDGRDYPNHLVYDEIVPPRLIVYTNEGRTDGAPVVRFQQTVTFVPRGGKTEVHLRSVFPSAAERDAAEQKYGAVEGARQTLARLGEHLGAATSAAGAKPELRMSRVFDAPKRLVFEAWSKAEYVSRWFTPAPLSTPSCEVDLQTGGVFRLVMRMPDGTDLPMDARFTEVVPEERIVFDAVIHGGLIVHTTVTFAERDGKTRLDVHQIFDHETEASRGAQAGWTKTLDQLAEHVRRHA